MSVPRTAKPREITRQRRRRGHGCWDHLICAMLWPKYGVNIGTLLRTVDATGACLAVPRFPWVPEALDKGNRLKPSDSCVHWVRDPLTWLEAEHRKEDTTVVAVELADDAVRLPDLKPAATRTVVVLGNERDGIPGEALEFVDYCTEIPMIGTGGSLNVAVAGSLILYRLAGLS